MLRLSVSKSHGFGKKGRNLEKLEMLIEIYSVTIQRRHENE